MPVLIICSGVDFDDADYGFKEEGKSKLKVSPVLEMFNPVGAPTHAPF